MVRPDASLPNDHATLPGDTFVPFSHEKGKGLELGLVTGRIYADIAQNLDARLRDFAALGIRILRLEIEQTTPLSTYAAIATAAKGYGIEILALVNASSIPGTPDPMSGTRTDFDQIYVPKVVAAIDEVTKALPNVRYVELFNEPDVYAFKPVFSYSNGTCTALEGAYRYALLAVRVFETMHERRKKNLPTPFIAAFDISRQDDLCVVDSLVNAQPVASHRAGYRAPNGLPDGLPTDIVSIHGYGQPARIPGETGYTYANGTFADGVSAFLTHGFADGKPIIGNAPVWYTEIGYSLTTVGGATPLERQKTGIVNALTTLRARAEVTAAFVYSYRDDEPGGEERCGLRDNSNTKYAPHPSYGALQEQSIAVKDVVAPAGALEVATTSRAGESIAVHGWALDADGLAPTVEIAVDGVVVASVVDGGAPHATACTIVAGKRCPNVGFTTTIKAPPAGLHEVAARARDAKGNARVIGRVEISVTE